MGNNQHHQSKAQGVNEVEPILAALIPNYCYVRFLGHFPLPSRRVDDARRVDRTSATYEAVNTSIDRLTIAILPIASLYFTMPLPISLPARLPRKH
jgi:hypothetical protein